MDVKIPSELYTDFNKYVKSNYGIKKGSQSIAVMDGIAVLIYGKKYPDYLKEREARKQMDIKI